MEKMFANNIYDNKLSVQRTHTSEHKKWTTHAKNGQNTWIDIFSKTYRWPTDTWKVAKHHYSSGKRKSKPQWGITSLLDTLDCHI